MALNPRNIARRGALAYVGAIALTGDQVTKTVDQLATRGAKIEHGAREQFAKIEHDARARYAKIEQSTRARLAKVTGAVHDEAAETVEAVAEPAEHVASAFEKGRDRLLEVLSLPTHADIVKLNQEIDRLSGEIDQLRKQARRAKATVAAPIPSDGAPPLPGYEKLNVEAVADRLPVLDEAKLLEVRAYEQEHGKRVTVLRAVERALVGLRASRDALDEPGFTTTVEPLPRYTELTDLEVVERLHGLDEAALLHVRVYEQQHAGRLGVLRAIEDQRAANPTA